MAAGSSGRENPHFVADIDKCVLDFASLIDRKYISTNGSVKMDFAGKVQYFTSDILSKLSFDAKFHDLWDDNDNNGYIDEVETVSPDIFAIGVIPAVIDCFTKLGLLDLITPRENSKLGLGKIEVITEAQIAKRFDSEGQAKKYGQLDMIGRSIRHGLTGKKLEQGSILQS